MVIQVDREKDELPRRSVSSLDPNKNHYLEKGEQRDLRTVDFWTMWTLEAFVTEFTIDTSTSFNEAERQFFKGPRGKYLNSFNLKIKMLLVEKGILLLESDC